MNKILKYAFLFWGLLLGSVQAFHTENWNSIRCVQNCTEDSCKNPQTLDTCKAKCVKFSKQLEGCFSNITPTPSPHRISPKAGAPKAGAPNLGAQKQPRPLPPTPQIQPTPRTDPAPVKIVKQKPEAVRSQPRSLAAVPRSLPTPHIPVKIENQKVDNKPWTFTQCTKTCTGNSCRDRSVLAQCQDKCQRFPKEMAGCFKNIQSALLTSGGVVPKPETLKLEVQKPNIPKVENPQHQALLNQLHSLQEKIEQKLVGSSSPELTTRSYLEFLKFYTATMKKFIRINDLCNEYGYKTLFDNNPFILINLKHVEENLNETINELNGLWEQGSSQPFINIDLYTATKDFRKEKKFLSLISVINEITVYLIHAGIDKEDLISPFDRYLFEQKKQLLSFSWSELEKEGLGTNIPDEIRQGFKIHISASSTFADQIFKVVSPLLKNYHWKFAGSSAYLDFINAHYLDQRGKFITIYPINDEASLEIAKMLDAVLSQFPRHYFINIPSDRPLGNSGGLFTRYGAYSSDFIKIIENGAEIYVADDRQGPWKHSSIPDIFEHDFPLTK